MDKLQIKLERLRLMLVEDGYSDSNIVYQTLIEMQMEFSVDTKEERVEFPNVESKEFQRWAQSKGYEPSFNGVWYEKNSQTYCKKILHRAFTNEIQFGKLEIHYYIK